MQTPRLRRPAAATAAVVLALPLAVGAALPATAADLGRVRTTATRIAGPGSFDPYAGFYGRPDAELSGDPYLYPSAGDWHDPYAGATTGALDIAQATASESTGLALISTELDFGAGNAAGTGIVLDSDGLVVTNHHVVEGSTDIDVTVATTGRTYSAQVVGTDAKRDIAVLQLEDASGLATAEVATSTVAVGDAVTAVGDAGGDGGSLTAAAGTVLRLHDSIDVDGEDGATSHLQRLIEVDADIIPGDSGGALLDSDGRVVGMNVAASSGGNDISGYVIPIARVQRVVSKVLAGDDRGAVALGYNAFLGVELATPSADVAGVLSNSPAADAGLGVGDTVRSLGGTEVSTAAELRRAVTAHEPGETVTVTWTDASGGTESADVTLTRAPVA